MSGTKDEIWRFGPFVLNEATWELAKDGEPVSIEPQSLRLLIYLIRHKERVVSRDNLVDAIWEGRAVSDWAISGAIKALRTALADLNKDKRFVKTIHSRGYRVGAGIVSIKPKGTPCKLPTLLVRIFRTVGDGTELEYLAEGLAEDLITGLSRKKNWRVLSYNTSRALADATSAANHGITTIVDGSVRRIGDTIRISLTPEPDGDRCLEVEVAQQLLQTMGFRQFLPVVTACPGCGRTTSTVFQQLAKDIQDHLNTSMPIWREKYPGVEGMSVAVMGCIVNGPGESKHADIGISLPGTGETPAAPVFIDGQKAKTLRGADIADQFKLMVAEYIEERFGT